MIMISELSAAAAAAVGLCFPLTFDPAFLHLACFGEATQTEKEEGAQAGVCRHMHMHALNIRKREQGKGGTKKRGPGEIISPRDDGPRGPFVIGGLID